MAKKSMISKNNKRLAKINHYFSIRREMKSKLKEKERNQNLSLDEYLSISSFLSKTRDASFIRYRNRCGINGKPRGFRRSLGLSRGALRHYASFGMIAGVKKG